MFRFDLLKSYLLFEQVYNVTKFLEDHPGGDEVLLSATGTKNTVIFLLVSYDLMRELF